MSTTSETFDQIADALHGLARAADEIIEVNFGVKKRFFVFRTTALSFVRHRRDPQRLFDRSDDEVLVPEPNVSRSVRRLVEEHLAENRHVQSATLRVYQDGNWSYGGIWRDERGSLDE